MIIDACMFLNEHELFDFRVKELDAVVDQFLVVEAEETFTGKPRYLQFNRTGSSNIAEKIRYVKVKQLYPEYTNQASGWEREAFLRDYLLWTCVENGAASTDIVIVSDCDEVPSATAVRKAIPLLSYDMCRFDVDCYYYNVHNWAGNTHYSPVIGTIAQYRAVGGAQAARKTKQYSGNFLIPEAGWHFSYWGGVARMREKATAFAHAGDPMCQRFLAKTDAEIEADIAAHRNIYYPDGGEFFEYRGLGDWRFPKHFPKGAD